MGRVALDLAGVKQPNGLLTARRIVGKRGTSNVWECVCACGGVTQITASLFVREITRSCGCLRGKRRQISLGEFGKVSPEELVGWRQEGGYLTIKRRSERRSKAGPLWDCECICGAPKQVSLYQFLNNLVVSCGCRVRGLRAIAVRKRAHVLAQHRGGTTVPELAEELKVSRQRVYQILSAAKHDEAHEVQHG